MAQFKVIDGIAIIPQGTTEIKNWAFPLDAKITKIFIPSSVREISVHAFGVCSAVKKIVVSDGNTVYDSRDNCNAIIETKTNKLVLGCSETFIPNSVEEIGSSAFDGCTSLTSITIPASVKVINENPFEDCENLSKITVAKDNTVYDSRDNCNAIIETKSNRLVAGCYWTVIPDTVTTLGPFAFCGCDNLIQVIIPCSVKEVAEGAFWSCKNLKRIVFEGQVKKIGCFAFEYCASLTEINIPDSVSEIGLFTFSSCTSLKSITIPSSVKHIRWFAFKDCSSLARVIVSDFEKEIHKSAFSGCGKLSRIIVSKVKTEQSSGN